MTKQEFLAMIQSTLSGSLGSTETASHIAYYSEYIEVEIRKGRSETDVVRSLGDPRLLAKSIIEASRHTEGESKVYSGEEKGAGTGSSRRIPGWLVLLIVIIIVIVVLGIITSLISLILPVLIPVVLIILLFKWLKKE